MTPTLGPRPTFRPDPIVSDKPLRIRTALAIALLAAALALTSGFVSQAESTSYQWSRGFASDSTAGLEQTLGTSSRLTPVLLSAHWPDRLEIRWACNLGDSVSPLRSPVLLVATTLDSSEAGIRLEWMEGLGYSLTSENRHLAQVPVVSEAVEPGCAYRVNLNRTGSFTLHRGEDLLITGSADSPLVTSISTDIGSESIGDAFVVLDLQTTPHGPSQSFLRILLRILAATLLGLATYLLLGRRGQQRQRHTVSGPDHPAGDHRARWIDAVVLVTLLVWWLVGPVLFDDGWIAAIVGNFSSDGIFTSFYDGRNAAPPLGYIHLIAIKTVAALSPALVWLRLPSLFSGMFAWLLTRSAVDTAVRATARHSSSAVRMTTASVFLLSWISWNNTVRAEPFIALLCAVGLWASIRFATGPAPHLLLIGSIAAAVAVSVHATGLVAMAAPLVALPVVVRWARSERAYALPYLAATAVIALGVFILALLAIGDVRFWLESRTVFIEGGHNLGFADEPDRYFYLFADGPSTNSIRWMSVLLPFIAPTLFLMRRGRTRRTMTDIPVMAFVVSLVLLAFGPSKWIWHFGALAPGAAAAVGVELHRLRMNRAGTHALTPAGAMAVLGSLGITSLAWRGGFNWQEVALVRWIDEESPPQLIGALLAQPLVLLAGVGLALGTAAVIQKGRPSPRQAVARAIEGLITWLIPVTASIAVTVAIVSFVVDGLVLAPGWSLAKQNLGSVSAPSCGLGDDMVVPALGQSLLELVEGRGGKVLMAPQIAMYFPCLSQPVIEHGVAEVPSMVLTVGVIPLGFGGSPYRYLNDIAELPQFSTVQASTGQRLPIGVILVEPRLTDDAAR